MAIRLSGLTSGMDTDAIVQELVSAYSKKTEKYEKASTKLTWKQDAWKSLNTKIYGLYTSASNMRMSGAYNLRKVSVSDNTKATITANSDAVKGTQKLNILKTAQAGYITGGSLGEKTTTKTTLADLGYTGGDTKIQVKKNDGTTEYIKLTKDSTITDVVAGLKEAGLNASFDANNHRLFISAKESGVANDFALSGVDMDGEEVLTKLKLDTALATTDKDGNTVFTASAKPYEEAYNSFFVKAQAVGTYTLDVDGMKQYINDQVKAYDNLQKDWNVYNGRALRTEADNRDLQEQLTKDKEALDALNKELEELEGVEKTVPVLDDNGNPVVDAEGNPVLTYTQDQQDAIDAKKAEITAKETAISTAETAIESNNGIIDEAKKGMEDVKTAQAALGIDELLEARGKRVKDDKGVDITDADGNYVYENQELMDRKIYESAVRAVKGYEIMTDTAGIYKNGGATKVDASDAVIKLNGVEFTNSTNSFNINGLSINATAVTGDGDENAVQVTTTVDTQGIYDKVKDFLTEYNNVINELCKLYNAESAKDYEPLTDEEKEAMSDDQIEKWETKIKDALLRRDGTVNSIMSAMVNSMAQTFEINGEKVSLSTFGISTLGFLNAPKNEHYAFHIDGDEDDENTSGKKDKLMAAIEEDPDKVMEFMKQLTGKLYSSIDEKMKSTELSSAYKVYNDKEMDKELARYAETIKKWEDKVKDKEDYYYKQFSQMEVALSKLQNQTSSISGLFNM